MNKKNSNRQNILAAIAMMCQDFVLEDQELMQSNVIKEKLDDVSFWNEAGENTLCAIEGFMLSKYKNGAPSMMSFIFDTRNRLEINDIILQSITVFIKNYNVE